MVFALSTVILVYLCGRAFRPRIETRTTPSPHQLCGEFTLLLSWDGLRIRFQRGRPILDRTRKNFLFAGYNWSDPVQ